MIEQKDLLKNINVELPLQIVHMLVTFPYTLIDEWVAAIIKNHSRHKSFKSFITIDSIDITLKVKGLVSFFLDSGSECLPSELFF